MNKIYLFLLVSILALDCKSGSKKATNCTAYFQFDQIDHYFFKITEDKVGDMATKKVNTDKEKKQLALLIERTPDKLADTAVLKNIRQLGYTKERIQKDKFEQINEIFCTRNHKEVVAYSCIAIYRDILVFKRNNNIIGTAKICFDCNQSVIAGAHHNTDEFGQSGDYAKLYSLLH